MASTAGFAALVLLLAAAVPAAMAVDYVVGDSNGWTNGGSYDSWVAGKTFQAGDTLTFNYDPSHSVVRLGSKDDYDGCSTGNALKSDASSPTKVTLDKAGTTYYFVCGTTIHCTAGMKLSLATAGGGGGGGSSTPSTPTTPATPSTPSATPSTPSSTPSTPSSTTPAKPSAAPAATATATAAAVAGALAVAALLV